MVEVSDFDPQVHFVLKFIYFEKATNLVDLSYVITVRSVVESSQNFVAFSEYMIFIYVVFLARCLECARNEFNLAFHIIQRTNEK